MQPILKFSLCILRLFLCTAREIAQRLGLINLISGSTWIQFLVPEITLGSSKTPFSWVWWTSISGALDQALLPRLDSCPPRSHEHCWEKSALSQNSIIIWSGTYISSYAFDSSLFQITNFIQSSGSNIFNPFCTRHQSLSMHSCRLHPGNPGRVLSLTRDSHKLNSHFRESSFVEEIRET